MSTRVVAVSGSQRAGSYTRRALEHVLRTAETLEVDADVHTELLDLRTVDLPLYDPDRPAADRGDADDALRLVRRADAVVLGSPVYHSSYSSTFKNFHDYCGFDEYDATVVGLVAVAGGGSYGSTLEHMRSTVRGVHGVVVPRQVGIRNAREKFDTEGVVDAGIRDRLDELTAQVVDYAGRFGG
ncbi:NADPH-dependent FMN reductase [Salinigranum sp. GCM10025319]|uniref:NADPH-dependent FMN reductase n=1 Tax=Salinigranum sp. GCM10025319 TaxID=3252687 RepID=UPI003607EE80